MKMIILIILLSACSKNKQYGPERLNYPSPSFRGLDPAKMSTMYESVILRSVFETLYEIHPHKNEYLPLLAEGFPETKDNKKFVIKIKKNIYFCDSDIFQDKKRELTVKDSLE